MQIVGGTKKGLKLSSVKGDTTRPILDRVKTALFDIIREDIKEKTFLDLFAGSGSVGLEALSQGSRHATFIDINKNAIKTLNENITKTKFQNNSTIYFKDAFKFLQTNEANFDIIFIAPPQYKELWIKALKLVDEKIKALSPDMIIVQIDPKEYKDIPLKNMILEKQKRYGNTILLFYKSSL
ncbi:MAG: 16S rRNA (guanine(966)-N(2))-methyltransferase RsmD [Bdellovibrionota bacterium]